MRKTLQDVASYLKEIMVPETHEAYAMALRCFIRQRQCL
ncbi:MAG: hypothetical protein K0S47_3467 [Herbinix sp.]|nr:hypothetical protein [Herbinix sp.]